MTRVAYAGHSQRLWPAFVMLMAVVILTTAGVFWFMWQAMQNEQLVIRQRMNDLYNSQLQSAAERIRMSWHERLDFLTKEVQQNPAQQAFASIVNTGYADAVLVYQKERLVYPESAAFFRISAEPQTARWREARNLEYVKNAPESAAEAYAGISRLSPESQEAALALLAQARCLNKAGQQSKAIDLLVNAFGGSRYRDAEDPQGRSVSLNALLFALQMMKGPSHESFQKTAAILAERLNGYGEIPISASQRRFVMKQLRLLWPDCPPFPTYAAEELAAQFEKDRFEAGRMKATRIENIWAYQTPDGSLTALFHHDSLMAFVDSAMESQEIANGIRFGAIPPGAADSSYKSESIGPEFPAWQLGLYLDGEDPFQSAAGGRMAAYVYTGILMTGGVVVISLLLAGYLRRQLRLTRLKNDLIATVSHELKTPLASMRLLVDTLLDGNYRDTQLALDYLQLISKENARLSSLIEGFLTFSRMENNKAKFERSLLNTGEIVHSALESVGNRLNAQDCHFELDIASDTPLVIGDRGALITVVVNLLDNALKYTGDVKAIRLRNFSANGNVFIEVQDNGIGFPRSAAKKIFGRFYQTDRRLSRPAGGCGLGLSIVQFIVDAHHGSVSAKSQPGKGSAFTVQLPAASDKAYAK